MERRFQVTQVEQGLSMAVERGRRVLFLVGQVECGPFLIEQVEQQPPLMRTKLWIVSSRGTSRRLERWNVVQLGFPYRFEIGFETDRGDVYYPRNCEFHEGEITLGNTEERKVTSRADVFDLEPLSHLGSFKLRQADRDFYIAQTIPIQMLNVEFPSKFKDLQPAKRKENSSINEIPPPLATFQSERSVAQSRDAIYTTLLDSTIEFR
ncbi:hypothetical protein K0M31_013081 [Melipona bicolor]|uniref:Uncharacterized protein n=1 Tax=Melipona bicolor TaxID=60889 RepID=A0AA40KGM9_9HYME|nr:hypothetical protein K0M31_013081 [Melipona bicolor]